MNDYEWFWVHKPKRGLTKLKGWIECEIKWWNAWIVILLDSYNMFELKQNLCYVIVMNLHILLKNLCDYESNVWMCDITYCWEHICSRIDKMHMTFWKRWITMFGQEDETWRKPCLMNTFRETRCKNKKKLLCDIDLLLIMLMDRDNTIKNMEWMIVEKIMFQSWNNG